MENKKKALGKGLEQLFSNNAINFDDFEKEIVSTDSDKVININLNDIRSNPYQPRKHFSDESLEELSKSIKEYGVVQPIILKKSVKGYELIAGERRVRASKLAGLETIPAIVKEFTDQEMMEIALLENIQREDLNPIEVAESINSIIEYKKMTQEEFSKKLGKSRSYVTNMLGLLNLPIPVKDMVRQNLLSMSHAKLLSKLNDEEEILNLANIALKNDLSVHELNKLIKEKAPTKKIKEEFKKYEIYEKMILDKINSHTTISKNKIEIKFKNEDDLIRILESLNISAEDI